MRPYIASVWSLIRVATAGSSDSVVAETPFLIGMHASTQVMVGLSDTGCVWSSKIGVSKEYANLPHRATAFAPGHP